MEYYEDIEKQEKKSAEMLNELTCPKCQRSLVGLPKQKGVTWVCSDYYGCDYTRFEGNKNG